MGRTRVRKKSTKGPPSAVAVPDVSAPTEAAAGENDAERRHFVEEQRLFSEREVQRRIAAIEAIRDAETENLLSRLRLLRSCLNKEQLATPALQFFKENFPNLSVIKKEDDGIFELGWKENIGGIPSNIIDSLGGHSTLPSTASLCPGFSARSFKLSLLEAAQRQVSGSAVQTPSLGLQDGLNTPGATSHRLSVGMTPKTVRLPKHGEMLLSVHGSPLGVFGEENLEAIHESGNSLRSSSL